jgi:hypothetical protein
MLRRKLLAGSALALMGFVAGCTTSTVNGVTTVTINMPTFTAYAMGATALVTAFLGFPGVAPLIGAAGPVISGILSQVESGFAAVNTAANGNVSFSFDTTSVPAFITALEQDGTKLTSALSTAFTGAGSALPAQAGQYYNGAIAVLSAIAALFSISTAASMRKIAEPKMDVPTALSLVHVAVPAGR